MASELFTYQQKHQSHHRGDLDKSYYRCTYNWVFYNVITTIIHAELEATNSKIYLLELEVLDTKITSKIRLNKIIEQAEFIAWNKKHNQ